jgi:hypothetical protein
VLLERADGQDKRRGNARARSIAVAVAAAGEQRRDEIGVERRSS